MRIAPREQDKLFLHQVRSPSTRVVCVDVDRDIGRFSRTKKTGQGSYPQPDGSYRSYCLCTARAYQRWQTYRRGAHAARKNAFGAKKCLSGCRIIGSRDPGRGDVPGWVRFVLLSLESVLISSCRVFLVTVHDPICTEFGNLGDALYGSFLPVPSNDLFPAHDPSASAQHALPGAIVVRNERIVINHGREKVRIKVTNNGDRPVQVSPPLSHPTIRCEIQHRRLDRTTTSSKPTPVCPSIAPGPTGSDWISPQVQRSGSNQAILRLLLSAPSPGARLSRAGTSLVRVS